MELAVDYQDNSNNNNNNNNNNNKNKYHGSHDAYQYLPRRLLEDVLARLTKLSIPLYNDSFHFQLASGIQTINSVRSVE